MNPNIAALTTLTGNTTYLTPGGTTAVVLLPNAASSNAVYRINQIVVANNTSTAANATVAIYSNGGVAQGSAPSGGTAFPVANAISVPGNASLIVVDKSTAIYLTEDRSITITSGTASALTYSISYEIIS